MRGPWEPSRRPIGPWLGALRLAATQPLHPRGCSWLARWLPGQEGCCAFPGVMSACDLPPEMSIYMPVQARRGAAYVTVQARSWVLRFPRRYVSL